MTTTVQRIAMIFGVVFLLVAILGFVTTGSTMEASMDTAPRLLGIFPVNMLHNIVHALFGVWGLAASRSFGGSRMYGRAGAVIYGLLVPLAFVSPTTFGLIPIGGNDIWLHAVLAAGLAFLGFGAGNTMNRV